MRYEKYRLVLKRVYIRNIKGYLSKILKIIIVNENFLTLTSLAFGILKCENNVEGKLTRQAYGVKMTSYQRHVASTSIQRHFGTKCPLGSFLKI